MDVVKIFTEYLLKRDLKNTPERATILNEIEGINQHFEPDTLLFRLKNKHVKISRATIYRTLELLLDCGLVKKNIFENGITLYEKNFGTHAHDHFLCMQCGKIIEFKMSLSTVRQRTACFDQDLNKIHVRLAKKHEFLITDYSHQIYGRCKNCK